MSKLIPLSGKKGKDKFVTVSDEDYDELMKYKWYLVRGGYAARVHNEMKNGHWRPVSVRMHRHIMGVNDPNIIVDHKDGNINNYERSNLRIASYAQNAQNARASKRRDSLSIYKGVSWSARGNSWRVVIRANGKNVNGGTFDNEIIAACRYDQLAREYHKEFAYLNFPLITNYDAINEYITKRMSSSKYIGVRWQECLKKWIAYICINNKTQHIGVFDCEIDAAKARDQALYNNRQHRKKIIYNFPKDYVI